MVKLWRISTNACLHYGNTASRNSFTETLMENPLKSIFIIRGAKPGKVLSVICSAAVQGYLSLFFPFVHVQLDLIDAHDGI